MNSDENKTIRKSFKYRCYPNAGTKRRTFRAMYIQGEVWSNATAQKSRAWFAQQDAIYLAGKNAGRELTPEEKDVIKKQSPIPTFYDQYSLIRKREHPQYCKFDAQSLQNVLHKVDSSFKSFFALKKNGQPDVMPPNQKRIHRCLAYRQSGWKLEGNNLYLSYIGKFHLKLHRPIIGKIKLISITENNGKWYASFSCEVNILSGTCNPVSKSKSASADDLRQEYAPSGGDEPEKASTYNKRVLASEIFGGGDDPEKASTYNFLSSGSPIALGGDDPEKAGEIEIAFGLRDNVFIIDSAGFIIEHPEFYGSELDKLKRLNQNLAQKKYRSENWYKARNTLIKWHERIENKRAYFLWNLARYYAKNFEKVTIQKWPLNKEIKYAIDNKTARRLCDGAYGKFIQMLKHKCNESGTEFIERKELSWQTEIERLTEQAKMEELTRVLRESKKAVNRKYHARFKYLETACERLMMLRI